MVALTSMGWMWAWSARVAADAREGDNSGFYDNKLLTGRFFMRRVLPQVKSLAETVMSPSDTVMEMQGRVVLTAGFR